MVVLLFVAGVAGCSKPLLLSRNLTAEEIASEDDVQFAGRGRQIVSADGIAVPLAYDPATVPDVRSPDFVSSRAGTLATIAIAISSTGKIPIERVRVNLAPAPETTVTVTAPTAWIERLDPGECRFVRFGVKIPGEMPPGSYPLHLLCTYTAAGRRSSFARILELFIPAFAMVRLSRSGTQHAVVRPAPRRGAPFRLEEWSYGVNPARSAACLGYNLVAAADDDAEYQADLVGASPAIVSGYKPVLLWPRGRGISMRQIAYEEHGPARRRLRFRVRTRGVAPGIYRFVICYVHKKNPELGLMGHMLGLGVIGATGNDVIHRHQGDYRLELTTPEGGVLATRRRKAMLPGARGSTVTAQGRYLSTTLPRALDAYFEGMKLRWQSTPAFEKRLAERPGLAGLMRFTVGRLASFYTGALEGYRLAATLGRRRVIQEAPGPLEGELYYCLLTRTAAAVGARMLQGLVTLAELVTATGKRELTLPRGGARFIQMPRVGLEEGDQARRRVPIPALKAWSPEQDRLYEGGDLARVLVFDRPPVRVRYDVRPLRKQFSLRGRFPLGLFVSSARTSRIVVHMVTGDTVDFYLARLGPGRHRIAPFYDDRQANQGGSGAPLLLETLGGSPTEVDAPDDDPIALLETSMRRRLSSGKEMAAALAVRRFRAAFETERRTIFASSTVLDRKEVEQKVIEARYDPQRAVTRFKMQLRSRRKKAWVMEWVPQTILKDEMLRRDFVRHPGRVVRLALDRDRPRLISFDIKGRLGSDFHDLKTLVSGSPVQRAGGTLVHSTSRRGLLPTCPTRAFRILMASIALARQDVQTFHAVDVTNTIVTTTVRGGGGTRLVWTTRTITTRPVCTYVRRIKLVPNQGQPVVVVSHERVCTPPRQEVIRTLTVVCMRPTIQVIQTGVPVLTNRTETRETLRVIHNRLPVFLDALERRIHEEKLKHCCAWQVPDEYLRQRGMDVLAELRATTPAQLGPLALNDVTASGRAVATLRQDGDLEVTLRGAGKLVFRVLADPKRYPDTDTLATIRLEPESEHARLASLALAPPGSERGKSALLRALTETRTAGTVVSRSSLGGEPRLEVHLAGTGTFRVTVEFQGVARILPTGKRKNLPGGGLEREWALVRRTAHPLLAIGKARDVPRRIGLAIPGATEARVVFGNDDAEHLLKADPDRPGVVWLALAAGSFERIARQLAGTGTFRVRTAPGWGGVLSSAGRARLIVAGDRGTGASFGSSPAGKKVWDEFTRRVANLGARRRFLETFRRIVAGAVGEYLGARLPRRAVPARQ